MIFLRGFGVWLIIILAETVHGILRNLWLLPIVGDFPSRQIGVFVGSFLILLISFIFIGHLKTENEKQLLIIGLMWSLLTVCFEFLLGIFIMKFPVERILEDYNLKAGGLMIFGLIFMVLSPITAKRLREKVFG